MAKQRSTKKRLQKERTKARQKRRESRAAEATQADLNTAIQLLQSGQLDKAKTAFTDITQQDPASASAWHCLAIVVHQQGDNTLAESHIQRAIALEPERPTYHSNLSLILIANKRLTEAAAAGYRAQQLGHRDGNGHVQLALQLMQAGHLQQAKSCLEIAAAIAPHDPIIPNCLGIVLRQQGEYSTAKEALDKALQMRPSFAEAHNNLGNVLRDLKQYELARESYQRAVNYKAQFPEAYNNLGTVLVELRDTHTAIERYRTALKFQPKYVEALNNLGNALRLEGDLNESESVIREAIDLRPATAEIHNNLGNVLRDQGRLSEAIQAYQTAINCRPHFAKANNNLGTVLVDQGEYTAAEESYRSALRANPSSDDARRNLGNVYRLQHRSEEASQLWAECTRDSQLDLLQASLCPLVFSDRDEIEETAASLKTKWTNLQSSPPQCDIQITATQLVEPPFHLQFFDDNIRAHKESYARLFDTHFAQFPQAELKLPDKPTVGVVVTRKHEGIFLKSLAGVLNQLPDADLHVRVFASSASQQLVRQGLSNPAIEIVPLPERFDLQALTVSDAACDLLYYWEIGTDASNYFLPFLRLAPIQMTSWGVQVTSGIPNVDHYLSSSLIEPANAADHYSERLITVPTILSFQEQQQAPPTCDRDQFGLPVSGAIYLCAQQIGKFHPDFDSWLQAILERDKQGIVVTTGDKHGAAGELLQHRLQRQLGPLANRIHMLPHLDRDQYLQLVSLATVCLDPPHFGGVNTTYDAVSLNKLVVSLPSKFHRGRYTLGCYRKMQLEELVADSPEDYVQRATRWANDESERRQLEREITDAKQLLFRDHSAVSHHRETFKNLIAGARSSRT